MKKPRMIHRLFHGKPVLEGAGVHLNRVFGFPETPAFDPFLLLDDFRSTVPEHYRKGFPWHPHRGIETITYMLDGSVAHGDSLGNQGVVSSGDVQWMTAGSGIIHQEMPKGDADGKMGGFQLWANLPAASKMMKPRYQDIRSDQIPEAILDNGVTMKVIAGEAHGVTGPVKDIVIEPQFLDIQVPDGQCFSLRTNPDHTVFAYIIEGRGSFAPRPPESAPLQEAGNGTLVLFEPGEEITARTAEHPMRFLLISGMPLKEPIAWQGPIVMNTPEELAFAFEEYRNGSFIK